MNYLILLIIPAIAILIGIIHKKKSTQSTAKQKQQTKEEVYIVSTTHGDRELRYTDLWGKQKKQDYNEKSKYYSQKYNYFVDNLGDFWRSYDDCKTFIREVNGEIV